jgi:hypothetical protein
MARAFLKFAISGRAPYEIARLDRASASVAGGRTQQRRPGVRAICNG